MIDDKRSDYPSRQGFEMRHRRNGEVASDAQGRRPEPTPSKLVQLRRYAAHSRIFSGQLEDRAAQISSRPNARVRPARLEAERKR
jgi:hypothetical protein